MCDSFSVWSIHKDRSKMKDFIRFKPSQRQIYLFEKGLVFCKIRVDPSGQGLSPQHSFKKSMKVKRACGCGRPCKAMDRVCSSVLHRSGNTPGRWGATCHTAKLEATPRPVQLQREAFVHGREKGQTEILVIKKYGLDFIFNLPSLTLLH